MRRSELAIFLFIVLAVYGGANFYILRRGGQALAGSPWARALFYGVGGLLVAAYPLGRILATSRAAGIGDAFIHAGSFYLALMVNMFFALVVVDIVRLADRAFRFLPRGASAGPRGTGAVVFVTILGLSILGVVGGYLNALRPRLKTLDVVVDMPAGAGLGSLDIVMASDIHLGTIMGSRRLETIVARINALEPDIVLLPGDIVDESVSLAEEERMIAALRSLEAPLGVFSVAGNHEYYGGLEKNLGYLEKGGVRVLQDEALVFDGAFVLAGRRDPTAVRFGQERGPISGILAGPGIDPALPVILLDHQPVRLAEAEEAGVALQLSGHTHAGQLFPLNIINTWVYEKSWGYLRKGRTQYYVSCGVGTWGPPVRTGSVPEIVRIRMSFKAPGGPEPPAPPGPGKAVP